MNDQKLAQIEQETQRKLAEMNREKEREIDKIEHEKERENSRIAAAATAGSAAAPEVSPIIGALTKWKEKRNTKKAQKREEKLENKRAKDERSIMKKQKGLMDKQSKNTRNPEENYSAIILLFVMAIIAHILDWMGGWPRPPNMAILAFWLAIVISHFFFISERHFDGDQNTLLAVVAITAILPVIIDYLFDTIQNEFVIKLGIILIAFPPLVLYFMFKFPAGAFIGKWYLYLWVILLTIVLITSPAAQSAIGDSKERFSESQARLSIASFGNTVRDSWGNFMAGIAKSVNRGINYATGQQYEGDEESRVGIFLEEVRPIEQEFYTSSRVYVQGKIRAQNIKETAVIKTGCYVPDTNITGVTRPSTINMVNDDENYIDCEFPGRFAPGSFEVKMTAQFTFTTEAKINYYFIDASRRPESYTKTKIPKKTVAIYTGGPVELGLPSLNQPLRISLDKNNKEVGDYPFGISLTNKWTDGKVVRGLNYTLDIPKAAELYTCNREWTDTLPNIDGRNIYTFYINNNNLKESFDSVTCRMKINDPQALLGADIERAPEITFKGTATYEYAVERGTFVNVIDDGISPYR